jgi:hypothetical protein
MRRSKTQFNIYYLHMDVFMRTILSKKYYRSKISVAFVGHHEATKVKVTLLLMTMLLPLHAGVWRSGGTLHTFLTLDGCVFRNI